MKHTFITMFSFIAAFMFLAVSDLSASRIEEINIMLIVDASSHSAEEWHDQTKFYHTRQGLSNAFQELSNSPHWGLNVGLRLFGDSTARKRRNCTDFRLAAKLNWFEPAPILSILENTRPKGKNCLAWAIASSINDFPGSGRPSRNFLICIISSRDECTKDELLTIQHVVSQTNLEAIYIIGIDMPETDYEYFKSMYPPLPGNVLNAEYPASLTQIVTSILNQKIQSSETSNDSAE